MTFAWRSCDTDKPLPGQRVHITRRPYEVRAQDTIFWTNTEGWNLTGLYWYPARTMDGPLPPETKNLKAL